MVTDVRRYEHITIITSVLRQLHWLLIRQRADFKLVVFAFRALHGTAPPELLNLKLRSLAVNSQHNVMLNRPDKLMSWRSFLCCCMFDAACDADRRWSG